MFDGPAVWIDNEDDEGGVDGDDDDLEDVDELEEEDFDEEDADEEDVDEPLGEDVDDTFGPLPDTCFSLEFILLRSIRLMLDTLGTLNLSQMPSD